MTFPGLREDMTRRWLRFNQKFDKSRVLVCVCVWARECVRACVCVTFDHWEEASHSDARSGGKGIAKLVRAQRCV